MLVQLHIRAVLRGGGEGENKTTAKKREPPHDKSNQSAILLFLYCMFLLCVYRYVYLYSLPHRI
jgi:hypothetical protein